MNLHEAILLKVCQFLTSNVAFFKFSTTCLIVM